MTTPPNTPPATPPANPPPASPPAADWQTGLSEELKGYVSTKGFKDPAAVVDSYRNLEKLHGVPAEQILKLPANVEDFAGMKDVFTRLGRPATADEYKIAADDKVPGSDKFAKWAKDTFFELGITRKQAEALIGKWTEFDTGRATEFTTEMTNKLNAGKDGLKKEWGQAHDQNIGIAKQAALALKVKPEVLDALEQQIGYADVMKMFHEIGTKVGEASWAGGGASASKILSPAQAQQKIADLKGDSAWVARYVNGGVPEKEEMANLMKVAYPEQS